MEQSTTILNSAFASFNIVVLCFIKPHNDLVQVQQLYNITVSIFRRRYIYNGVYFRRRYIYNGIYFRRRYIYITVSILDVYIYITVSILDVYIYNIRTLSVNIKFICTSFRNRQNSEPKASFQACFAASTNEFYI